tara:strand:- start:1459 stop:2775 length:1317 start_codon:yes stop_codon:yes gene_type:complete
MIFTPHSQKQELALFSEKRIVLCSTGIQWGKTTVGASFLKMRIHEHPGESCNYIVTAPNYKILQQATLPEFLKVMEGCGTYKKVDATFELYSGACVYFRTATDPDSIIGITNVYGIWGDEAGKYPYYFWINLQGRANFKQCPIILTTSLYSFNWVCKELIREHERGLRDDIHLCQAESRENPHFPEEEYQRAKKKLSPARFAMMYGGRPAKREGLVYDCFDDNINIVEPFSLPEGTRVYAGIDWGYTQPFSCAIFARLPSDHFVLVAEVYQTRMTLSDIIDVLKQRKQIWNIQKFYAGPDQPGYIQELNKAGLFCEAANNDVKKGIDVVYSLIKESRLKVFKDQAKNILDEFENYHWPELKDLKPDQDDSDPNPVKQDDHGMDSVRYCLISVAHKRLERFSPTSVNENDFGKKPKNETIEQKLKRLKSRKDRRTETWS